MSQVNAKAAGTLMQTIDRRLAAGMTHLHLMLSSPGGSVFHGLSLHNFLKGCGAQITTYNFGSVDSIGVVIFCAGTRRYSVPNARFHIHGVKLGFNGTFNIDEKGLEEHIKLLKTDYMNIARVIAATTGRDEKKVVNDMNKQTSLMPEQAAEYGLIHEVRRELIPAGAGMAAVYEDGAVFEYHAVPQQQQLPQMQQQQPAQMIQPPQAPMPGAEVEPNAAPVAFTGPDAVAFTGTLMGSSLRDS